MQNRDAKAWISPEEAILKAIDSIRKDEIQKPPHSAPKIRNGTPSTPFFVKRIDKENSAYFLVPWMDEDKVTLIVQINATNGEFQAVSIFEKMKESPIISCDSALKCAKTAYPKASFINRGLVWKPCEESTDPFNPFYLLEFGDSRVYVSMKCTILTSLTPLGKGG